ATGASQNDRFDFIIYADGQEAMTDFSSRGPCEDGRIKPDLVPPGSWIASLKSASAGDENAWAPISDNYMFQGGTSQAGPPVPGAVPALVNDLDLEVIGPDGTVYHGNQFDQGESIPNSPARDNINNVEAVYLSVPMPGEYIVRVRAQRVVEDSRVDTQAIDQDFALVISADIQPPGTGLLLLARGAHT